MEIERLHEVIETVAREEELELVGGRPPPRELVHEYDDLDDEIVLDSVREARRSFNRYVRELEEGLDQ